MILTKLSGEGWEKHFSNEEDLKAELFSHICPMCRDGFEYEGAKPVNAGSSIWDMLSTACGCEYMVENLE